MEPRLWLGANTLRNDRTRQLAAILFFYLVIQVKHDIVVFDYYISLYDYFKEYWIHYPQGKQLHEVRIP